MSKQCWQTWIRASAHHACKPIDLAWRGLDTMDDRDVQAHAENPAHCKVLHQDDVVTLCA